MVKHIFGVLFFLFVLFIIKTQVQAAVFHGSGVYTNLCGTGLNANANSCQRGCNTNTGSCSASGNTVVKYTCDGRLSECRSNESSFSSSQSVAGTACGKTVQIDVFNKTCRVNGGWNCGNNDLIDYMVWYSGDCQQQPTATPVPPTQTPRPSNTPIPTGTPRPTSTATPTLGPIHTSSCNALTIVSGNNSMVPANVTLQAAGQDSQGSIQRYRFFFGDGKSQERDSAEVTHRYESSGTFRARVEVRDSKGNWKSSSSCETTVTVKPIPIIESQKSACSNVFITEGNNTQAPTTAKFSVTGYDNKGAITNYRLDFGDGTTLENASGNFEKRYETPGTYVIRGYIYDSQKNWKGGEAACKVSLYVNTKPMEKQPSTGTPTLFSLIGIGSGIASLGLVKMLRLMNVS